jgi:hypothetical protein
LLERARVSSKTYQKPLSQNLSFFIPKRIRVTRKETFLEKIMFIVLTGELNSPLLLGPFTTEEKASQLFIGLPRLNINGYNCCQHFDSLEEAKIELEWQLKNNSPD